MADKFEELKKDFDRLIAQGTLLCYAMADDLGKLSEESKKDLKKQGINLPKFKLEYDTWYSEALLVVKQIIPDRLNDFINQYKVEKRKEVDALTYGVSDYMLGLQTTRGYDVVVATSAALPKMQNQNSILESAKKRFESSLFDISEVLQADLFDSELDAARELCKKGFVRGAGAIVGVVLEKHLGHVCTQHGAKSRKKHPSISDFNDLLKQNNILDTPKWRFVQHLGDLRNLCDHKKEREPTKDDVLELIEGVEKVIKTVH